MTDRTALAHRVLAAMDLTRLADSDTPERIEALCASADTPWGRPAAVCVHPEFVATARAALARPGLVGVRVATVVNFPDGADDADRAAYEIRRALAAGADEIDAVLPWRSFRAGHHAAAARFVRACRDACGERTLKLILETGELRDDGLIERASELAIAGGADFIKTSTGKVPVNATPSAARIMLETIRGSGGRCGFKAAGGIRTLDEAAQYFVLADAILGPDWATPARFRLGASALLGDVLGALGGARTPSADTY